MRDGHGISKKIEDFVYGKTKTINPISKFIRNCPNEDLDDLKELIFRGLEHRKTYH